VLTGFVTTRFIFLWGYIKDIANCNNPYNLDGLKTNISNIIANISPMMLQSVSVTWWCTVSERLVARCIVDTLLLVKFSFKEAPSAHTNFTKMAVAV
jgi:hypothetical protein